MEKRIGIFGGSFDPIHKSHKAIVDTCIKQKLVDEVWILPSCNHKEKKNIATFKQRIKMCKLMFNKPLFNRKVKIKNYEKYNVTGSTYCLIQFLKWKYPDYDFKMIIGRDCADNIETWYKYRELIQTIPFIIFERNNYYSYNSKNWYLSSPHLLIKIKGCSLSSTFIRDVLTKGFYDIAEMHIGSKVIQFILKEKVYNNNGN
jgi:nicotinate-nucleotide adenylyltransferase